MNERLKKLIFKKLYEDLSQVEIIQYKNSIWFINRVEQYWYFEYQKSGVLWWRYQFFDDFFQLFCLDKEDYESIICEWVEEVLNCKVNTTDNLHFRLRPLVEEVLNYKVNTPVIGRGGAEVEVEEVLNCKVNTPKAIYFSPVNMVEEVLNCKVNTPHFDGQNMYSTVEEVLNCKVNRPSSTTAMRIVSVEEVLNYKVIASEPYKSRLKSAVEEILNKITI